MVDLTRVKERIETDLSDTELQAMIDEITAEIEGRYGANGSITVFLGDDRELDGYRTFLSLVRPLSGTAVVTEIDHTEETVVAADDFRVIHDGRTLERLNDGTTPRTFWQRLVKVVYVPVSDVLERDEITILLVQLGIEYRGLKSEKAGDHAASYMDYTTERTMLINRLSPRRGVLMA